MRKKRLFGGLILISIFVALGCTSSCSNRTKTKSTASLNLQNNDTIEVKILHEGIDYRMEAIENKHFVLPYDYSKKTIEGKVDGQPFSIPIKENEQFGEFSENRKYFTIISSDHFIDNEEDRWRVSEVEVEIRNLKNQVIAKGKITKEGFEGSDRFIPDNSGSYLFHDNADYLGTLSSYRLKDRGFQLIGSINKNEYSARKYFQDQKSIFINSNNGSLKDLELYDFDLILTQKTKVSQDFNLCSSVITNSNYLISYHSVADSSNYFCYLFWDKELKSVRENLCFSYPEYIKINFIQNTNNLISIYSIKTNTLKILDLNQKTPEITAISLTSSSYNFLFSGYSKNHILHGNKKPNFVCIIQGNYLYLFNKDKLKTALRLELKGVENTQIGENSKTKDPLILAMERPTKKYSLVFK